MKKIIIITMLIIFAIMSFMLESTWQYISLLLLILTTFPVSYDAIMQKVKLLQTNKVETWQRKNYDYAVDNIYQMGYAVKKMFVKLLLICNILIYTGGFICSITFVIGLFYNWLNIFFIMCTVIYITVVLTRTTLWALSN